MILQRFQALYTNTYGSPIRNIGSASERYGNIESRQWSCNEDNNDVTTKTTMMTVCGLRLLVMQQDPTGLEEWQRQYKQTRSGHKELQHHYKQTRSGSKEAIINKQGMAAKPLQAHVVRKKGLQQC